MTNHLPTKSPDDQSINEHSQPISGHKTTEVNTPQGDELRDEISMYVESAYLHGLCVENLDTGKLEPPRDISDVAWITDKLMHLITTDKDKAVADSAGTIGNIRAVTELDDLLKEYQRSTWGNYDVTAPIRNRLAVLRTPSQQPNQGETK